MFFFPFAFLFALILAGLLVFAFALVQIGLLGAAFARVGLSPGAVPFILLACLLGSGINIPIRRITARRDRPRLDAADLGFRFRLRWVSESRHTLLAVNLGGAIIPTLVSIYLLVHTRVPLGYLLAAAAVAVVVHRVSRPIPGFGIAVPVLVAPLVAAAAALILAPSESAPAAYVAGTLGCLVGADLMNLHKIAALGAPVASIGGAGTFEACFSPAS